MTQFPNIPGYKIERILGQGGMATVYLALQESIDRLVALKVLSVSLTKEGADWDKRFVREAKIVAKLSNQYIIPIYDVGSVDALHYMAMEYLPGGDLKQKMRAGLALPESIRIVKEIAAGLGYAASKNLVHRDIKPENILFREDNSPVISDFGVSRLMDAQTKLTQAGAMVGTPYYMSPEQAQGLDVDPRSDIYSLGVILYEMLTGEVPFSGNSAINVGLKHISQPPPPLPTHLFSFQPLIKKVLAKRPDDRFQSGKELSAALSLTEMTLTSSADQTIIMSRDEIKSALSESRVKSESRIKKEASAEHVTELSDETGQHVSDATLVRPSAPIPDQVGRDDQADVDQPETPSKSRFALFVSLAVIAFVGIGFASVMFFGANRQTSELHEKVPNSSAGAETRLSERAIVGTSDKLENTHQKTARQESTNQEVIAQEGTIQEGSVQEGAVQENDAAQEFVEPEVVVQELTTEEAGVQESVAQEDAAKKVDEQEYRQLIEKARVAISQKRLSKPKGNSAFDFLRLALLVDEDGEEAIQGLSAVFAEYEQFVAINVKRARPANARRHLATQQALLERRDEFPSSIKVTQLFDSLSAGFKDQSDKLEDLTKALEQQRLDTINRLVQRAKIIKSQGLSAASNDELRETYLSMLEIDPGSNIATKGLLETSDYEAAMVSQKLKDGKISEAHRHLMTIANTTPNYAGLSPLQERIAKDERASSEASKWVLKAESVLTFKYQRPSIFSSNRSARDKLRRAYDHIDKARKVYPQAVDVQNALVRLEDKYVEILTILLKAKDEKAAGRFISDTQNYRWSALKIQEIERQL